MDDSQEVVINILTDKTLCKLLGALGTENRINFIMRA